MEIPTIVDLRDEGGSIETAPVPVVDILSLFQYLFDDHGVSIPDAEVKQFWKHASEHIPWARNHPATAGAAHVPISLYGDEARYTSSSGHTEKIVSLNVSMPLWCPMTTRNSRFPFFAIRQGLCVEHYTIYPILQYATWCINILSTGLKPTQGYLGKPLPPNLLATRPGEPLCRQHIKWCLTELRGDWAWHMHWLQLRNRWNSNTLCFKCWARKNSDMLEQSCMDYSDSAWWIDHQVSHCEFLQHMIKQDAVCNLTQFSTRVRN